MSTTPFSSPPSAETGTPEIDAPPLAPTEVSLCFVVDEEPTLRHFLSLILHGFGVDTVELADGAALREVLAQKLPHLVFHNVTIDSADAIESINALGQAGFRGSVQLMSSRGGAVLEHVKGIGIARNLAMLPVLKKPFETEAIVKIIQALKPEMRPSVAARLDLDEALSNNWVEFWYQPKINLRKKQLAGAEAYARTRHPELGIVMPDAFMPGATESALITLSERALVGALKTGANFSKLGVNLRLAVNIPVNALVKVPVEEIVRSHHPQQQDWPGLIIDVPEAQIINDLALAHELTQRFQHHNVSLAIDNFGSGHAALAGVTELPFAEIKLDRSFVADCSSQPAKASLCKTVIDLAHNFGGATVALGIEKATDAVTLMTAGSDFGQGFLFGQPMPEERFVSLLRQRAATQGRPLRAD